MESLHQNLATLAEGRVFPQSQSTVLLAFVKLKSKILRANRPHLWHGLLVRKTQLPGDLVVGR